jgi:sulfatase maturation enzyme AslB (radical SAM superfamily)
LGLDVLENKIKEILIYENIDMVDLYGGEVGLLQQQYINDLVYLLEAQGIYDINIITNLSMVNDVIKNKDLYITVSYDFDCREQHDRVWNNMVSLDRPFSILILASECLLKKNVDEMIHQLNLLKNLQSVEIKPYSTNQANCHNVTYKDFENHVRSWIDSAIEKQFQFINEKNILQSLSGTRNAFSNDHVYITPTGDFAVLEFDLNDNEYFKDLN